MQLSDDNRVIFSPINIFNWSLSFKEETISTFVWIPIRYVQEGYEITEPTEQGIARLMRDLPGEAG